MLQGLLGFVLLLVAGVASADAQAEGAGELPRRDSVSQYGIAWHFDRPVPVGQFVNGDYYVVGPVTVTAMDPAPTPGRNGSMLNPPMAEKHGYDDRPAGYYEAGLAAHLPMQMKPGDSLVSTISHGEDEKERKHVLSGHNSGEGSGGWIRTAAVLTCLTEPVPADTFRPSYAGHQPRLYRYSDLRLDLLPSLEPTPSAPTLAFYERVFERPWLDHVYGWGSRHIHPTQNMPDYGRDVGRAVGEASLLLECNYPQEQKRKLLVGFVQYGIDLWGVVQAGGKGWPAQGGYGCGRKWPIVFAGILFQDGAMQRPKAEFDEDDHTGFGPCWTGATVVFTGQFPGYYRENPQRNWDRGPFEHLPPEKWGFDRTKDYSKEYPGYNEGQLPGRMGESYRRTCGVAWVGQALAGRLMKAEKAWDHDAFFVYCDRWMYEDDTEMNRRLKEALDYDYGREWMVQRRCWDPFVNEMWARYREGPGMPPADEWKKERPGQPRGGNTGR